MITDHLLCPDARCINKRNLLLHPRCLDHTVLIALHMSACTLHHKSDAVDQPNLDLALIRQHNACSLLRDKFRFRRHNRFARS